MQRHGKNGSKLGIDSHYFNPIPIFEDFISIPSGQIPVPATNSHFPSLKIDKSQFPFYPFRALYIGVREENN
jgi:hypothetical protein